MQQTNVEGGVVKVGDYVSFKSDIEQSGTIIKIYRAQQSFGMVMLDIENMDGFEGNYIGGQTHTTVMANDCWVE